MTEDQIKHMVNRFLSWKLPRDTFNPDCGISFDKKPYNTHTPHPSQYEPSGTNLFDATQAAGMVRHMLDGLPSSQHPTNDVIGWAVIDGGKIKIKTISDTRRAAIINFLVVDRGTMIFSDMPDDQIERLWFQYRRGADVETVRIEPYHIKPVALQERSDG